MTVKLIEEMTAREGCADALLAIFRDIFPTTREFPGCGGIDISVSHADRNVLVMTSNWASVSHHKAYLELRRSDGTMARFRGLIAGPPRFTYLDLSDA